VQKTVSGRKPCGRPVAAAFSCDIRATDHIPQFPHKGIYTGVNSLL
jgi:hypothetical protein